MSAESPGLAYFAPGCALAFADRPGSSDDELVYTLRGHRSPRDGTRRARELEEAAFQLAQLGALLEVAPPPLRIVDALEADWRQLPLVAREGRHSPAELYQRQLGRLRGVTSEPRG